MTLVKWANKDIAGIVGAMRIEPLPAIGGGPRTSIHPLAYRLKRGADNQAQGTTARASPCLKEVRQMSRPLDPRALGMAEPQREPRDVTDSQKIFDRYSEGCILPRLDPLL